MKLANSWSTLWGHLVPPIQGRDRAGVLVTKYKKDFNEFLPQ